MKQGPKRAWKYIPFIHAYGLSATPLGEFQLQPPLASTPVEVDVPCDAAIAMTSPGGGWSNLHVAPYLHVPVFM